MVQTPIKPITLTDFLQLPETKPANEYIDGQIVQKPMPKTDHGILQTDLAAAITACLRPNKIGRAITELRCTFEGRSIVPDITVLPWHEIPRRDNGKALAAELFVAPSWMIEILSSGQNQTKVVEKILYSLEHGTQMGWLIDPSEECVFVYTADSKVRLYQKVEQPLPVPSFAKDFELTVGSLISWLYE
ncbi:MAG: Uma2 family endonuclease [Cyanobacteria bacterium J06614_10]